METNMSIEQQEADREEGDAHRKGVIAAMIKEAPYANDFVSAWVWLVEHPAMQYRGRFCKPNASIPDLHTAFPANLDIDLAIVNHLTNAIDDDKLKNTKPRIWIEVTTFTDKDHSNPDWYVEGQGASRHDYWLDCAGDTFENAIVELANNVWVHYGKYGRPVPGKWDSYFGEPRKMEI